jgi:hypothetical protein
MSEATGLNIETIYVRLLNEGTSVLRPTKGEHLGGMTYRLLPTEDYDNDDEQWEFPPGTVVKCIFEIHDGARIVVANSEAMYICI